MRYVLFLICLLVFITACNRASNKPPIPKGEFEKYNTYYYKGLDIYAKRNHLNAFSESIRYLDSAATILENYENDSLKQSLYSAIAKSYDAWGKMPEKTMEYMEKAIFYSKKLHDFDAVVIYTALMAGIQAKNHDSAGTITTINLCNSKAYEAQADSMDEHDDYFAELAYTASKVKNFPLTATLLNKVTHPEKLKTEGLNFKIHYLSAQSALHLEYLHTDIKQWEDTIKWMITHSDNLSDSLANYSLIIYDFRINNQLDSATKYEAILKKYESTFGILSQDTSKTKASFLEHQVKESEKDKQQAIMQQKTLFKYAIILFVLLLLLSLAVFLVLSNRKKIAIQNKRLALLNEQLDEKAQQNQLMVKEMHHRVKNNLYLMYSLLEMQGRRTKNKETREQLAAARTRIESIAITHEQLYQNHEGAINMHTYLSHFVNTVISSMQQHFQIVPVLTIDPTISLPTHICLPLAMLINEWLTNTAKYAITSSGKVYAYIHATINEDEITLQYHDSGKPINPKEKVNKEGLGSKIIQLLCKQLNAEINVQHGNQLFHYQIKFKQ